MCVCVCRVGGGWGVGGVMLACLDNVDDEAGWPRPGTRTSPVAGSSAHSSPRCTALFTSVARPCASLGASLAITTATATPCGATSSRSWPSSASSVCWWVQRVSQLADGVWNWSDSKATMRPALVFGPPSSGRSCRSKSVACKSRTVLRTTERYDASNASTSTSDCPGGSAFMVRMVSPTLTTAP